MNLNFNDFEKQKLKFDINELQKAYNEVLKIKDFSGPEGISNFGAPNHVPKTEATVCAPRRQHTNTNQAGKQSRNQPTNQPTNQSVNQPTTMCNGALRVEYV